MKLKSRGNRVAMKKEVILSLHCKLVNYNMSIKFRLGHLTLKRIFISLSITLSRRTHVVANNRISMFLCCIIVL